MKIRTVIAILFSVFIIVSGCKKAGIGKKTIEGTVYFNDGVSALDAIAPGASVYITYGSKVYTGTVDEETTSDSKGIYDIKGLKNDDYFIWASYTTSHGFTYTTAGHGVTVVGKDLNLNIRLY